MQENFAIWSVVALSVRRMEHLTAYRLLFTVYRLRLNDLHVLCKSQLVLVLCRVLRLNEKFHLEQ